MYVKSNLETAQLGLKKGKGIAGIRKRKYVKTAKIGLGARFSKVPLTLWAPNQVKTALPAMLIKDIFQNLLLIFFFAQNLTMFGVDIIVEKGTGHHVVIDINYFPGKCSWYMISTVEEASRSVSLRVFEPGSTRLRVF